VVELLFLFVKCHANVVQAHAFRDNPLTNQQSVGTEGDVGNLNGRRALVTGAGIAIGQGVAIGLAKRGARVAVHYAHSAEGAEHTVAEIRAAGGEAVAVQGDLRFVEDCTRVVDQTVDAFGGIDILINNSGVTRAQSFEKTTEAIYDEMLDLNMKGYFFCAQRALKYFTEQGNRGAIVNVTSVHGISGAPDHAAYAATKGAIIAFTRSLAVELADRGIRVNAVGPGLIEVPRYFDRPGYTTEIGASMVPIGRVGTPEDIANMAAFLVSDEASFITGQTFFVDGGSTSRMGGFRESR
jgi:NAD(P)-dependent dehydrogenase (short-subunit alcohol dehydrogenase family)